MVTFIGHGSDDGSTERYTWRTDNEELYNGTDPSFTLSTLSVGIHEIYLKVQDNFGVWSDEEYSILAVNPVLPDFKVISLDYSSQNPKFGENITFSAVITNDGNSTAKNVSVAFRVDGGLVGTKIISTVSNKETVQVNLEWKPSNGNHTLQVVVDSNNEFAETDESNNERSMNMGCGTK